MYYQFKSICKRTSSRKHTYYEFESNYVFMTKRALNSWKGSKLSMVYKARKIWYQMRGSRYMKLEYFWEIEQLFDNFCFYNEIYYSNIFVKVIK